MPGFRSPLFLLGISAAPVSDQGSVRSMLAPWIGGASAPAVTVQAGCRSFTAFWMGGACAPPAAPVQAGCRSMLAFWMGGVCAGPFIPPPPVITGGSGDGRWYFPQPEAVNDDDFLELLTLVMPLICR